MNCKVCRENMRPAFTASVLNKYDAAFFKCWYCGYLCAADPFWLNEAYNEGITSQDTGLLSRNNDLCRKVAVLIYYLLKRDGTYLDYAGGYGIFTRLMRESGFKFFHTDKYTKNLFAADYEWDQNSPIDGITCFECLEHLADPLQTISELTLIAKTLLFTTVLLPEHVPAATWDYYAFDHGQHISFYSDKTLQHIAESYGLHLLSVGNLHLFTEEPMKQSRVRRLLHRANRIHSLFYTKTTYEYVASSMRRRNAGRA